MSDYGAIDRPLSRYSQKGDKILQVLVPYDGVPLVKKFAEHLVQRFYDSYNMTVRFLTRKEDINRDAPLIDICYNHSRIGTDINNATAGILEYVPPQKVAVVVLHFKQRHALPVTMPTDALYEEWYQQFGALVDFAYNETDKIYDCDMNDVGNRKMNRYFQQHFKPRYVALSGSIFKVFLGLLLLVFLLFICGVFAGFIVCSPTHFMCIGYE